MSEQKETNILIVDDTNFNLRLLSQMLGQHGYKIRVATSGALALQLVQTNPPDLILLDIMMPEMDGYQVCQRLKADGATRDIPIIFISALEATEDKVNAFVAGGVDYITKPFRLEEVLARVRTHLSLRALQKNLEEKNIQLRHYAEELEREKLKSDRLLLNILPASVANDLKETGATTPRTFENVTALFLDIVDFTDVSAGLDPVVLIGELNEMFTAFDNIVEENECERIKTVGDAYLAVCGMPEENDQHARHIIQSAIEVIKYLEARNKSAALQWRVRIGLHSGPVVGGVVGIKKYIYDVFGDTINTAARMQTLSEPMRINVSESTCRLVGEQFRLLERGPAAVKGKGTMRMYFVEEC